MLVHVVLGVILAVISSCIHADDLSIEEILDSIETAEVTSVTATVSYAKTDPILDRLELRTGKLLFQKGADNSREAAILFDTLTIGRRREEKLKHYIFSGRWMAEVDHDNKQFIKRELVAPGEKDIDPFELGNGPIPLPIGQTKESVLSKFTVERIEKPKEGLLSKLADDVVGLHLVPKTGDAWKSIDLFYNPETWLPVGVRTIEKDGTLRVSRLTEIQLNTISPEDAQLLNIETPDPKEWSIDIRPWGVVIKP
jgi:outer membrane lipoprotein-sorting protein